MDFENILKNYLGHYLGQYLENYLGNFLIKYLGFINRYPAISTFIIVVVILMIFFLTYLFLIGNKRIFKNVKIKGRMIAAFSSIILVFIIQSISLSILLASKADYKQLSSLIWIITLLPLVISLFFSIIYVFSIASSFNQYINRLKTKIYEKIHEKVSKE